MGRASHNEKKTYQRNAVRGADARSICSDCEFTCGSEGIWKVVKERTEFYGTPQNLDFASRCDRAGYVRAYEGNGIPVNYSNADYPSFDFSVYKKNMDRSKGIFDDFFEKFLEWEKEGMGLYLWSKTPGSGKTYLACCLGRSIMIKYDLQMRFVSVPDYLALVGESYNRERGTMDESQVYRECRLLILDDIGTQKKGDWQEQELFRLIDSRAKDGFITIYTSNLEPEYLNLASRTISRLTKNIISIQMPEESIRKVKEVENREMFLKSRGL